MVRLGAAAASVRCSWSLIAKRYQSSESSLSIVALQVRSVMAGRVEADEVIACTDKHGEKMEKAGRLRLTLTRRADAVSIRNFLQ